MLIWPPRALITIGGYMKKLLLASGLGLALMNFSFADEPVAESKGPATTDSAAACQNLGSEEAVKACVDKLKEGKEGAGEATPSTPSTTMPMPAGDAK